MDEKDIKRFLVPVIVLILAVLSFLILKPLLISIISGLLFAYIFYPLYKTLNKKLKIPNLSATIIIIAALLIVIIPPLLLIPSFIKQLFEMYLSLRSADLSSLIFQLIPSLGTSQAISVEISSATSHFSSALSGWLLSLFQETIMNIPTIIFGIVILLFTFFFALIEAPNFKSYFSTFFPFSEEHQKLFLEKFEQVTNSVVYGHIILGIIQGIISGIGYYMFGVPNALLLTVATTIAGILPVVGPWLVWVPADIFLFLNGNVVAGTQLLIFSLVVLSWSDIILRPYVVAAKAQMNSAIALIGAIGGTYAFGILGFVLGPLVLAYFILLIELFKDKKTESIVLTDVPEKKST